MPNKRTHYEIGDNGGALIAQVRGTAGAYALDEATARKAIDYIRSHVTEDPDLLIEILGLTEHDNSRTDVEAGT